MWKTRLIDDIATQTCLLAFMKLKLKVKHTHIQGDDHSSSGHQVHVDTFCLFFISL